MAKLKTNKKLTIKELKAKEERRQWDLEINRKVRETRNKIYNSVCLEVRRELIRLMHEGMRLGDAAKKVGIEDNDVAFEIYVRNNKKKTYTHYVLNNPEDVK